MRSETSQSQVREAVGVFFDATTLHAAVDELTESGFTYEQLGLLAGESTVAKRLGEFYERINESADTDGGPRTAFIANKSMGDTVHAFLGTLFIVGTTVASGAVVASAAILGGALLTALAGAAALGGVGAVMSVILHENDAEELEQQVDEGHLLLFVRVPSADAEEKALEVLSRHGAFDAKVYSAPSVARSAA